MFISTPIAGPSVGAVALPDGLRERANPGESRPIDMLALEEASIRFGVLKAFGRRFTRKRNNSNCCQYPVQRREKPTEPAY
jgi:hypothetical protein